jgi:hypothetical protein
MPDLEDVPRGDAGGVGVWVGVAVGVAVGVGLGVCSLDRGAAGALEGECVVPQAAAPIIRAAQPATVASRRTVVVTVDSLRMEVQGRGSRSSYDEPASNLTTAQ